MVLRFDELGGPVSVLDVGDGFGVRDTAVGGGADPSGRVLIEVRRAVLVGLGLDNAVEEDAGAIRQDERVGGSGEAGDIGGGAGGDIEDLSAARRPGQVFPGAADGIIGGRRVGVALDAPGAQDSVDIRNSRQSLAARGHLGDRGAGARRAVAGEAIRRQENGIGGGAHEPLVGAQGTRLGLRLVQRRDGEGAAARRHIVLRGLDEQVGIGQGLAENQAGGLEGAHRLARSGVQNQDAGAGAGDCRGLVRIELEGDVLAVGTGDDRAGRPDQFDIVHRYALRNRRVS